MKISTLVSITCNKLLAFVVSVFLVKKETAQSDAETSVQFSTGADVTRYTGTGVNSPVKYISDDLAEAGSFLFPQRTGTVLEKLQPLTLNVMNFASTSYLTPFKHSFMKSFLRQSGVFAIALLIANLFFINTTSGQVTTATGGGAISANNFVSTTYTSLTGPVYTEAAAGNVGTGTIILNAPGGFRFDITGTAPTVLINGSTFNTNRNINHVANGTSVAITSITTTQITFTVTFSSATTSGTLTWQNIRVIPTAGSPLASGNITKSGTSTMTGVTAGTTNFGTLTEVAGAANKLVFSTQPGSGTGGSNLATQPAVTIQDQFGNTATGAANSITLAIGTNPGTGTLSATTNPLAATAGIATFAGVKIDKTGTGYTLTASAAGLTGATSNAFNITVGTAAKLAFTSQPGGGTAGTAWVAQPGVTLQDAGGNTVTGTAQNVTLAIQNNAGPGGTLSGTLTVAVNTGTGLATFSGLSIDKAGTGYTLTATGNTVSTTPGTIISSGFNITAGAASKLGFSTQPGGGTGGTAWGTQPIVAVQDAFGNTVTGTAQNITLAIQNNAGPGGVLSGTLTGTVNTGTGLATFSGLSIDKIGTGYTLTATGSTLSTTAGTVVSSPFNITLGAAAKLAFLTQPGGGTGGVAWGTQPVVVLQDAGGNTRIGTAQNVTLSIQNNAGPGGTLGGTVTIAVNTGTGLATFTNLSINTAGTGYTLTARGNTVQTVAGVVISSPFNITTGPISTAATGSTVSASPTGIIADGSSTSIITVQAKDAGGNNITSGGATVVITASLGSISAVTDNGNGTYTATLTSGTVMGTSTIGFSINSVTASNTTTVTFTSGPVDHFLVEASAGGNIATQVTNTAFTIRITAQDANNNTVTSFNGTGNSVDITSTGTLSAGSGTTPTFANGVLASRSVTISNAGTFTITATRTSGGAQAGTSNSFIVIPAQASTDDFRTRVSGQNWTTVNTWERSFDGGATWVAASAFPTATTANTITVQTGHVVTISATITNGIDQTTIQAGGEVDLTGGTLLIASGSGTDLDVFGKFVNTDATAITTTGSITFESGSEYHDNIAASSTIPTANWDANSTCFLDNWSNSGFTKGNLVAPGQNSFGNFTIDYNSTSAAAPTILPTGGTMSCTGNFTFNPSGSRPLNLVTAVTNPTILNVGKDFIYSSSTNNFTLNAGNTAAVTLNVTGNFNKPANATFIANNNIVSAVTINLTGDFISANSFTLNSGANGTVKLNIAGNFNNGGSFTAGTSTVTFNGTSQSILGGSITPFSTVTISNGSTVTGNTQHNAAIFNINGGGKYIQTVNTGVVPGTTRNFAATSSYEWQTGGNVIFPSAAGVNFGNLVINAPGNNNGGGFLTAVNGSLFIKSGSYSLSTTTSPTLSIGGNLEVDGGTFNLTTSGSSPIVNVTGDVLLYGGNFQPNVVTGTPSITLKGDWTNNGGTYTPGLETVTFNNTASNQNINGTATTQAFNNLVIAKSATVLNFSGSITGVTANSALTMTSGNINPGPGGTLQLGTSTAAVGTLNYTAGNIVGIFKRWVNTAGPLRFPLGDAAASGTATANRNALVTFTSVTGGSLTGNFIATDPGSAGLPLNENGYSIMHQFSEGYWPMVAGNGLASTNYAIALTAPGFISHTFDANSRVIKRPDGGGNWTLNGTHAAAVPPVANRSGLSGFSEFALADAAICATAPTTATINTASTNVCAGVTLTITGPPSGGTDASCGGFEYQYSTDGGTTWLQQLPATNIPSFTSVSASGITNNIIQARRINCVSDCGTTSLWGTVATWTVNAKPIVDAGLDQDLCYSGPSVTLAASPSIGTWSIVNGPSTDLSQFTSISDPHATFKPNGNAIPSANTYTLRWTINDAVCGLISDDVVITDDLPQISSIAGSTICNGDNPMITIDFSQGGTTFYIFLDNGFQGDITSGVPFDPTAANTYPSNASYTLTDVFDDINGCERNSGFAVTPTATVTVNNPPQIAPAGQPANQVITYGNAASFSVTATGDVLTYQWQEKVGVGSFTNITDGGIYSNATTPTLTISAPTVAMNGNLYRCVVSGYCPPAVTSNDVTLTVNPLTVTVTADAGQTKVYGAANPASYTYTSSPVVGSSLPNGDVISFTGALSRATGESVGPYAIGQNDLANSNYNIIYNGDNFTITPLTVTVTADAGQTKVYGASDPAVYTYSSSPAEGSSLPNGDVISFTGALSRATGESVGPYAIGQNNLANSNYNIIYNGDDFTITPLTVTVTADAGQTKVYGEADPVAYTYTSSPAVGSSLPNGDVISFTGALSRASGESVGPYAIGQNNLANSNYNIIYNGDDFTITPLTVTVTADAGQTKVYGAADPVAYTYTSSPAVGSSLPNGDVISFTGALSRAAGESVGPYAIGQNNLANSNYNIIYNGDNFTITPLTITVTADAGQTKVYGASDPAVYTYSSSPAEGSSLPNGDVISFTGALSRATGESVGPYAIGQNNLANSNYNIIYNGDDFTITPLTVTVTADAGQTKVYGEADPVAYTYTSSPAVGSSLPNGDVISFTGALSRATGESVGPYAIGQNNLANSNYNIIYNGDNFTITPLTVTVTADAGQTKVYGAADPAVYTYTSSPAEGSSLPNGDVISFTGALSRATGESVGPYAIGQNNLANSNYNIIYNGDNFTITPLTVTVTADAGQTKVYGAADPVAYTYTSSPAVGSSLPNGDVISFTGALSRATGESVGPYAIGQNDLANSNYNIIYNGDDFTITPLTVTVTADAGQTKVYGAADPVAYTYTSSPVVGSSLPNGDVISFTGALSRATGESVGPYAIGQNDLANSNYNIIYNGDDFTITPLTVTVTADAGQTKVYGAADPVAYTYTSSPAVGSSLPNGDVISFTGALSRATGESVGPYAIGQNDLANSNYNIIYNGDDFTITPLTVTVTADAGQTKVYGAADPAVYTYTSSPAEGSSLANGDVISFTGALSRAAGESVGPYAIGQNDLANSNYTILYNGDDFTITLASLTITAKDQVKCNGDTYNFMGDEFNANGLVNGDVATDITVALASAGTPSSALPGTYTITAANATGASVGNYTINYVGGTFTVNARPTSVVSGSTTICNGSSTNLSITFTGTAPFVYSINGGSPITTSSNPEIVPVSPTATTTYMVTSLTDANCAAISSDMTGSATVTVLPVPTATITGTTTVCEGATAPIITFTNPMALPVIITYTIYDGSNTTTSVINVNAGVTATVTKSTAIPGTFTYTITGAQYQGTPNCQNAISGQSAVVTVYGNATISLTSVTQTTAQNVCMDFPIEDITYAVDGGATGAYISAGALPNGVTGSYAAGVFTISGSPTAAVPGTYNYTVTTIGSCGNQSLSGSITVGAQATIVALPTGSQNQVTCANTPISNITFVVGGSATGATAAGLPSGLTGSYNAGIFTISGTPNVSGTFNYTVFTTGGPCTPISISGTITINLNSTITLTSSAQSAAQNICIGNNIAVITYEIDGGSTGGVVTGLPAGVTGVYTASGPNDGVFTISGTPTVTGTFTYTVTTQGPCSNPSLSGTIAIGAASTISLSSPVGSDGQAVCVNNAINTISYAIGGGATGASITAGALPSGVTGTYSAGVFTISGTPTASGNFSYTVTATGPCTNPSMNGTITVNPSPIVNGISNVIYCNNAPGAAISFTSPNSGVTYHWTSTADVGFGLSGSAIGGFTATNNTSSPIIATVSVTATGSGCTGSATTFTITVNPTPVVTAVSNLNYCAGSSASAITFNSPTTGGTVTYDWSSTSDVGFGLSGSGSIGAFTAKNNGTSPVTATVTVTPVFNGICGGTAIQFNVTVTPNAAGTINGPSAVCTGLTIPLTTTGTTGGTWSSSNPAVASVGASTGIVSGITGGSVTITYSVSGSCGTSTSAPFAVTVNAAATAGTVSGPPLGLLCAGSNFTLTTTGTPGGFWFSTTPGVATVDIATGVATGVAPGFALIYYVANPNTCGGGGLAPITFMVTPSGTNAGTITGATNHICPNGAPGGVQLSTTGSGGSWSSGNTVIATVSASGFVSGVASGTTTIYYTVAANSCGSGSVAQYNITVDQAANAGTISGPGGSNTVCAGSQIQLITNGASGGQWSSGSPAAIVNASTGLVTGQAAGSAVITYTVNNNCGQAQATFTVNVNAVADAGNLSGPSSVCTNAQIQIMSSGTSGGTWSSSDMTVATVDANGVVLGKNPGLATITYTVTATCAVKVSSSINITVNPLPVAGTVSDATICNGSSTSFTSVGGTSGGSWSSSNTAVATINAASGVAVSVGPGSTIITYTVTSASGCGTVFTSATLTVKPVLSAGTISGGSSVCAGSTLNLTASGNSGGSWSTSDVTVATVNGAGVVTGVAAGNATITYTLADNGCGIATATQVITVNPVPGGITVSGASTICKGLSTSFTSNATGGTWSSSDITVATVNAAGVITGVAAGTVTITYTVTTSCGTASGSANITIQDAGTISSLSGGSSVCVGSTIGLTTSGTSGGTWSSSAPGIAAVNAASGVVTGMAQGVATITYTFSGCGNYQATFTVTVNDIPDAGTSDFVLNPDGSTPVLCPGSTASVKNTGGMGAGTWKSSKPAVATVDANGLVTGHSAGLAVISYVVSNSCGTSSAGIIVVVNSLPDAGTINGATEVCAFGTINLSTTGNSGGTWTSSNPAVATVDATSGAVSGLLPGTTTIIYTVGDPALCGTSSATHVVTVNPVPYAGTLSNASVCSGQAITMAANGSVGGTWSSSNTGVATVSSGGVVTGVAAGITTISYTVSTPTCGSATATATVTVNPLPVAGPINGPTAVCVTGTITLSSTNNLGTYNAGGTGTAKWSSSSNSIATVAPNTGIVTGQAAGNVTITYTVTTDCGVSTSTYLITVNPLPNAGTISGGLFVCTGSTTSLTSSVTGGTWSSSNTAVATVNASTGMVTGVTAGSSIITYTVTSATGCGTASNTATVTVGDLPNAGTVTGAATLCAGSTAIFTSDGTGGGSWSSNNPAAATVDASGVVTGVAAGSATITYTVSGTCGSSSKSANITINAAPNAGAVSGVATLCVGATTPFTTTGASGGSWSSNNSLVATVNASGVVTAVGPGSASITYTVTNSCGGAVASATVTVSAVPQSGTVSGASTLCVGATTTFTRTGGDAGGLWESSDNTIATVDANGVVTGVTAGSVTIKYTVTSANCGSSVSSASITINGLPTAGITNNTGTSTLTCTTQSISVTATGGGTYSWSGGLGNAANATITAPGVYTVTVTSASGCSSTANIAIGQNISAPTAGITNNTGTTVLTCTTQSISVMATGGGTYSWSGGLGNAAAATISAPGTYTVTVTSGNGCTNTASITITQNITLPTAGITNNTGTTVLTCNTTTISVTATGGGTYSWSGGLGNAAAATITAQGTYTVTVTSANGCSSTASIVITQNTTPPGTPGVGTITQPSCGTPTGSVVLSGLPSTGTWTLTRTPGGTTTGTGSTATITGLPANQTYHFTVKNDVGCVSGLSGDVVINAAPALPGAPIVGTITQPTCAVTTGSVALSGLPASGTWTLTRTPGGATIGTGTTTTITGLPTGTTYTFKVTNAAGCTSAASGNVVINPGGVAPSITASNITVNTDPNSCSASVTLGSNITVLAGAPVTLQYRIGFSPFFSFPIPSTYTFSRGTTPVIVIATNSCGSAVRAFLVTVNDNTPPTITCQPNATRNVNGNSSRYSVHGHEFDATATDGCGIASMMYSLSGATVDGFESGSVNNEKLNIGTTTITWRATDVNGNVSTCSFTVTVTHNGNSANPPEVPGQSNAKVELFAAGLTVNVAPNPASDHFTLTLNSRGTEKVKLNVVDVLGRPVEKMTDIAPNSTIQIGGKYHPGIYMVQAIQGQQTVVLKLIKEGN